MRHLQNLLLAGCIGLSFTLALAAADVKVIANPSVSVSAVSTGDLKEIFLETKTSLGSGDHVVPVLLKSGPAHQAFLKDYVGKTDSALETYYRSLVFTGRGSMPKTLTGDAEVVSYVAKTKGAVGYVGSSTSTAGVKVLEVQ